MKHLKIHSKSGSNWYFRIGDLVERIYTVVRRLGEKYRKSVLFFQIFTSLLIIPK